MPQVALTRSKPGLLGTALTRGVRPELLRTALTKAEPEALEAALNAADPKLLTVALTQAEPDLLATALQKAEVSSNFVFLCVFFGFVEKTQRFYETIHNSIEATLLEDRLYLTGRATWHGPDCWC